jgi:hypothetical protein
VIDGAAEGPTQTTRGLASGISLATNHRHYIPQCSLDWSDATRLVNLTVGLRPRFWVLGVQLHQVGIVSSWLPWKVFLPNRPYAAPWAAAAPRAIVLATPI